MPNKLFSGETGAGKTTAAVEREMLPHFRDGGIIVTNITLKRERWVEEFGEEAVAARLIEMPQTLNEGTDQVRFAFSVWEDFKDRLDMRDEKGRGPMFVIDEAHKAIPAGMRFPVDKKTGQRDMEAFPNKLFLLFTDQRHYLINLILITQDPFQVASPILSQLHTTMYFCNAEEKAGKGSYTAKIWSGKPPRNYDSCPFDKCNDAIQMPRKYNKETWEYFVSNTKSAAEGGGRELEGKYRNSRPIWKRPLVMFILPAAIAFVGYQGSSLFSRFGGKHDAATGKELAKPAATTVKSMPAPPARVVTAEYHPDQVIGDLEVEQQVFDASETQRVEAGYVTYLYTSYGTYGPRAGPVVITQYPQSSKPIYALLTDYAAFWGYSISPAHCGWRLTRKDHVRELVDPTCLSRRLYENASAAVQPSASSDAPMGSPVSPNAGAANSGSIGPRFK